MATLIERFRSGVQGFLKPNLLDNSFNRAFYSFLNNAFTSYDTNSETYIKKGYLENPIVYSVINQMADKTKSIPYTIKKITNDQKYNEYNRLKKATGYKYSTPQYARKKFLELKAFEQTDIKFPLERPNPNQTWSEILALYKTFMAATGNCYLWIYRPKEGMNKNIPRYLYVLPSQYVNIVIKSNADLLGTENPIDYYKLIIGNTYVRFEQEDVIHVKYPNPDYDINGSHLYGVSPLRSGIRNIQSTNEGIDLNVKSMKNGGAFGLIHGESDAPLLQQQADSLKQRLKEMDADPSRLAKIAGISTKIGFTRINLSPKELELFEFFKFDQKQICNVLNWSDALLNNDDGGKYDKQLEERKRVISNNIMPDLELLANALNDQFLPAFPGYENTIIEWDESQLEEMQPDMERLVKWMSEALDRAVITREEFRFALGYPDSENPQLSIYTTSQNIIPLADALIPNDDFDIPIEIEDEQEIENEEDED